MSVPPSKPRHNAGDENEEQASYVEEQHELPPPVDELLPVDTPETAAMERDPSLPPVAVYETNGGPLGCCLGMLVGILVSLLLGLIGFGHVTANVIVYLTHVDTATNIRIATAFFTIVGAVLGGYFGWKVGKRLYREYEPPVIKDRRRKAKTTPKEAKF
ncbi:MAG TPA: hypothetical protein VEL69_02180 [Ktedonobacteraceae bacterium]|nr:hypothetical protein [Ktedonobacteraceae bacterium]